MAKKKAWLAIKIEPCTKKTLDRQSVAGRMTGMDSALQNDSVQNRQSKKSAISSENQAYQKPFTKMLPEFQSKEN